MYTAKTYETEIIENPIVSQWHKTDCYLRFQKLFFHSRDGCPIVATNYDTMFRGLTKKYNKGHEEALPSNDTAHLTPYVLFQLSQCRNEPESVTLYRRIFQHHHNPERLRT